MNTQWKSITAVLFANTLSTIGNVLSTIAIPWFVYRLTGNALVTASVVLVGQLPAIIVGLVSGSVIDRFGAKRISLCSDAVNVFAVLAIPFFYHLAGRKRCTVERAE